jgi:hypothetical protein
VDQPLAPSSLAYAMAQIHASLWFLVHLQHETLPGWFTGSLTAVVGPHSCKLFVLTPVPS